MFTAGNGTCFFSLRPFENMLSEKKKKQHINILRACTEETNSHSHHVLLAGHSTDVILT